MTTTSTITAINRITSQRFLVPVLRRLLPGAEPPGSASGRQAAVLTDQPTGHGSVGKKPAASAVLADGDGQGLSISVLPACLALVSQAGTH